MWFFLSPLADQADHAASPALCVYVDECLQASLPPLFEGRDVHVFDAHGLRVGMHTPATLLRILYAANPVLHYAFRAPCATQTQSHRRARVVLQDVHCLQMDAALCTWLSTTLDTRPYVRDDGTRLEKLGASSLLVDGSEAVDVCSFFSTRPRTDEVVEMRVQSVEPRSIWLTDGVRQVCLPWVSGEHGEPPKGAAAAASPSSTMQAVL